MVYELYNDILSDDDINSVVTLLRSRDQLTMSKHVKQFEEYFAEYLKVPYAVMVNSGSSANLLTFAAVSNMDFKNKLNPGDEVLIPAICWSTSMWPIVQMGLTPKLVDICPESLEINIDDLLLKISEKTRGLLIVHVIGLGSDMDKIVKICEDNNILLLEDSCECLGTTFNRKHLGTFGKFGTFSFYFSHHITTIEGGMVVCNTLEDYNLLKCLRCHGWSRDQSNKEELENIYSDIDPRFLFINVGYNLRPTEINGLLGVLQLKKLENFNDIRKYNYTKIIDNIINHPENKNYLSPIITRDIRFDIAWFAIPIILNMDFSLKKYTEFLTSNQIYNRPIISGNFCRQPALIKLGYNIDFKNYMGAEKIHNSGFYIGISCIKKITEDEVIDLVSILLSKQFFV